jgi:autotransporter-associated beta strand protein
LALAACLLVPALSAFSDSYWIGPVSGSADFNNPTDWNGGYVPEVSSPQNNADNDNGANSVMLIQAGDPVWGPWDVRVGDGANASGYDWQTGDTINVGGWFRIADSTGSSGTYRLDGGTLNCELQAHVGEVGTGYLLMNGGTMTVAQDPFCMGDGDFGSSPTGYLVMNGGTITTGIGVELWLGEGHNNTTGGMGYLLMTNGTINIGSWLAIGRFGGIGDLEMAGGSITMYPGNTGNITLGTTPGTGLINQSGGSITNTATQTWVAETLLGTWNLYGGEDVLGVIHLTQNPGATGTFNLYGGDLFATEITDNAPDGVDRGYGTFNFYGGTLHAGASSTTFMHDVNGSVTIAAGSAKINTEGYDVTISAAITDNGAGLGLTKMGAGTLSLTGANTYSGTTLVTAGGLMAGTANTALGTYTVSDGAGFGAVVTTPATQFTPATVNLGTATGGTLTFDLGSFGNPTAAPLDVTGTLTVNGAWTVNILDGFPQLGQFHLLQFAAKAGSGTFTLGTLPSGVTAALVPNGNFLDLNITAVGSDVWDGLAGGNWDIGLTTNWVNFATLVPTTYTDGDLVQFDDSATGSTVVNLVAAVKPHGILFNNSTNVYTLLGTGSLNGTAKLVKQGSSSLAIYNNNGYTAPTVLDGGTIIVTNLVNGGSPSPIGASSSNPTNLVMNGGTLSYQGVSGAFNRGMNIQANYGVNGGAFAWSDVGTLDTEGDVTVSGSVTAATGGTFVKTGPGTLTFVGSVTNQLSAGANDPGFQVAGGTLVFDGSAGNQVNNSVQEFWVGDTTNSGANIILTNTTLNVGSWFSLSRGNGNYGWNCNGSFYNSTMTCGNFSLGWQNGRPNLCTQNLTVTNSTIIDGGAFFVAESGGSTGTANITGNSVLVMGKANPMLMGLSVGATGNVVVANSSIVTNYDWLSCGANGYGTLTLKDNALYAENSDFNFGDYGGAGTVGILTIQDNAKVVMIGTGNGVYVGKSGTATGIVYQSGNSVINARSAGVFQLGQSANTSGTWYQSGGTNYGGGWVSIGRGYTAGDLTPTGLLVVSGGLFDQTGTGNGLIVGEQGTGTLLITNSGVVISEANNSGIGVAIGWNQGAGELDLGTGGTLIANYIQNGSGTSTLNLNGGLLKAGASPRLNFLAGLTTATILSGVNIDTGANTLDIAQPLQDGGMGGGLTKVGVGTLLMDGANAYAGATTVSAGTLGGVGSFTGPVVVANGATLSPGEVGSTNSIGTLTLGGTLSLGANSATVMELNKTTGSNDMVTSTSTITYGGTLVIQNLSGALQAGDTFTLFTAANYSGSFSSVLSQTPNQTVTWDLSKLSVNGTVKVLSAATTPVAMTVSASGGNLSLSWPANQTGWELLQQADSLSAGFGTNWVVVAGSATTNQVMIPVNNTLPSGFFRLVFPKQ